MVSNQIIDSLFARKSVRAYTDEPVSADAEQAILEAACQAPTAGNRKWNSDFSREMTRSVRAWIDDFE